MVHPVFRDWTWSLNEKLPVVFYHKQNIFLFWLAEWNFLFHVWDFFYISSSVCAQLFLTLWDPMDHSPLDSSVHVIFQARILERLPFPTPIFLKTLHLSCLQKKKKKNTSCTCPFCTILKSNKFLRIKIISFIFPVFHHTFGLTCWNKGDTRDYEYTPKVSRNSIFLLREWSKSVWILFFETTPWNHCHHFPLYLGSLN